MYQPDISKSPLLGSPVIERDYASGIADGGSSDSVSPVTSAPSPSSNASVQEPAKRTMKMNMASKDAVTSVQEEVPSSSPAPESQPVNSDPVDSFEFQDNPSDFGDAGDIDPENVTVEIPDDVAKETAKQLTLFVDMAVAMISERKMTIDMNSIRVAIAKGEMHPVFEEKFEQVNENNKRVAHLSAENKKAFTQALVAIIKDQKIQALNPTNAAIANLIMIAISHYGAVSATIASNERMIASALEQTVSNEVKQPHKDSNVPVVSSNRQTTFG